MIDPPECHLCGGRRSLFHFAGRDELLGLPGTFRMHRCKDCGLVFLYPRPDPETLERHYPETYPNYRPRDHIPSRPERTLRRKEMLALRACYGHQPPVRGLERIRGWLNRARCLPVPWVPGGVLLDVGCATGHRLEIWKDLGWEVYGVEPNPEAVGIAESKFPGRIRASTLEEAGFESGSFDAVTIENVLEHVPSPRDTLAEIHRVLKPGGRCAVRVPNLAAWETVMFRGKSAAADMPRHLWIFNRHALLRLLAETGFEIESVTTFSHLYTITHGLDATLRLTPRRPVTEEPQPRWVRTVRKLLHAGARGLIPLQRLADRMESGSDLTVSALKRA